MLAALGAEVEVAAEGLVQEVLEAAAVELVAVEVAGLVREVLEAAGLVAQVVEEASARV